MEKRDFKAFISYRHQSPDADIAKRLHKLIETYTIPGGLRGKNGSRHPGRVFRDQEELPLSPDLGKDIETALDNSEWLIAVCSPRYLKSLWCMRELEYFIEKKGRDRVLTVLVEGEPADSFPEILSFGVNAAGEKVAMEPLAADVRGATVAESLKKLKKEKLRLLAPMLDTSYDGLYQRQRRRAVTRGLIVAAAAVLALGSFLAYALVQNRRIDAQRVAAAQNECDLLAEKSVYYTSLNRKNEARQLALDAWDVSGQIKEYHMDQVRDALAAACFEGDFTVRTQVAIPGAGNRVADLAAFSPDGKLISAVVSYTQLVCCDTATGQQLWISNPFGNFITDVRWSEDSRLLAVVSSFSHTVCVIDAATGERIRTLEGPIDPETGNAPKDAEAIYFPQLVCFMPGNAGVYVVNQNGLWQWDYAADQTPEKLLDLPVGQFAYLRLSEDKSRILALINNVMSTEVSVMTLPDGDQEASALTCHAGAKVGNGAALSPDGSLVYVHLHDTALVIDPAAEKILWQASDADSSVGIDIHPLWYGNRIIDEGTVRSAETGEILYTVPGRILGVSPDGKWLLGEAGLYHAENGSLYAEVPGTLMASNPSGTLLLVRTKEDYTAYQNSDGSTAMVPLRTNYYTEVMPGSGSQYVAAQYDGTLVRIPDWTDDSRALLSGLYDPYGKDQVGIYAPKQYISPDHRYIVLTNIGDYVSVYDLERGNEPVLRLYDFNDTVPVSNGAVTVPQVAGVAFQQGGPLMVIAGISGYLAVYNLETGLMEQSHTDMVRKRALYGVRMNRDGTMFMTADYNMTTFYVYSLSSGLHLYNLHATGRVKDWGFDEETGNAVILYRDGSAAIARTFSDPDELHRYAVNYEP